MNHLRAVPSRAGALSKRRPDRYVGVEKDVNGGMTTIGRIIRDAKVFSLISDNETCENWTLGSMDALLHRVNTEWDEYGCMVSNLPPKLFNRHQRLHRTALKLARQAGWTGEMELEGDS